MLVEHNTLIKNWLDAGLEGSEKDVMEKAISMSSQLVVPALKTNDEAWELFLSKNEVEEAENVLVTKTIPIADHVIKNSSNAKFWTLLTGIAAMVIAVYIAFFSPLNSAEVIKTEAGFKENSQMILPSGTKLILNSGSATSYSPENWYKRRVVNLMGEAFFDVTKGVEFTVKTSNGQVTVLGTSFNVFSRGNSFFVECFSGRVLVSTKTDQKELTPGKKVNLENGRLVFSEIGTQKAALWRLGEFYFDTAPLKDVISEMERQFDIKFIVKSDISERYYSGFFSKNDLKEALQLVFVPMGLSFKINDGKVTVQ